MRPERTEAPAKRRRFVPDLPILRLLTPRRFSFLFPSCPFFSGQSIAYSLAAEAR
jgi:hypothetical protein